MRIRKEDTMNHLVLRMTAGGIALAVGAAFGAIGSGHSSSANTTGQSMRTTPSAPTTTTTTTTPSSRGANATTAASTQTTTTQRGPSKTGQPSQDCESLGNQPGNAISAPGSAFNPSGTAGGVYAGEQPQNSGNTASVSQYDVACARPTH
jgi:hypothetical protein